jgi:hypothetical protein
MDDAVALSGMEYGGITPIGIPADWAMLVDSRIPEVGEVVIGAGIRAAKIVLPGSVLAGLPGAQVVDGLARDVPLASAKVASQLRRDFTHRQGVMSLSRSCGG